MRGALVDTNTSQNSSDSDIITGHVFDDSPTLHWPRSRAAPPRWQGAEGRGRRGTQGENNLREDKRFKFQVQGVPSASEKKYAYSTGHLEHPEVNECQVFTNLFINHL